MFEHRFRELIAETTPTVVAVAVPVGFVPCPCPVLAAFSPAHLGYVAEVYRIAQELTRTQLRKAARSRIPQFSAN